MNIWDLYCTPFPDIIYEGQRGDEMERLHHVGMNCGCEYTSFPLFQSLHEHYTRHDHSVGTALIVWRFTRDPAQSLAALFHDIATPCFAHVVDFMLGDHMTQESTEDRTQEIIERSEYLNHVLKHYGLSVDDVADYHRYPIADNDSPQLSADRLEYTCGNLVNFGKCSRTTVRELMDDLIVGKNEKGEDELMFRSAEKARLFAFGALDMGKIYVSDEDRFSMQMLAELLRDAVQSGTLSMDDLWKDEPFVIRKLCGYPIFRERWERFRGYREIVRGGEDGIVIHAKKRYIDPAVVGKGRMTDIDSGFRDAVQVFLDDSQGIRLTGLSGGFPPENDEARPLQIRKKAYDDVSSQIRQEKRNR